MIIHECNGIIRAGEDCKGYRSKKRAERVGRRRSKYLARTALTRIEREQTDD